MERICSTSDIAKGSMKGFTVNNRQILVANVDGNFYAMDAVCSHMQGYLPDGKLEKNVVICPVHHARYDVTTGKVVKNISGLFKLATGKGASDLHTFSVTIQEGSIYVDV
jgi:nitrite reductase/ring-hydroxylating ferredoxin subunit